MSPQPGLTHLRAGIFMNIFQIETLRRGAETDKWLRNVLLMRERGEKLITRWKCKKKAFIKSNNKTAQKWCQWKITREVLKKNNRKTKTKVKSVGFNGSVVTNDLLFGVQNHVWPKLVVAFAGWIGVGVVSTTLSAGQRTFPTRGGGREICKSKHNFQV